MKETCRLRKCPKKGGSKGENVYFWVCVHGQVLATWDLIAILLGSATSLRGAITNVCTLLIYFPIKKKKKKKNSRKYLSRIKIKMWRAHVTRQGVLVPLFGGSNLSIPCFD